MIKASEMAFGKPALLQAKHFRYEHTLALTIQSVDKYTFMSELRNWNNYMCRRYGLNAWSNPHRICGERLMLRS